ncbi:hypothetical protein AB0G04_05755 [Actinoplanes sp. NPDC023801]|uniref:hypothetical protein n=1 Tax=Actinoplanes sp. NPDC023801 TaxID=3154595 RepID=UPI003402B76E
MATAPAERRPALVGALTLVSTGPDLAAFRPQPLLLRMLLSPPAGPLLRRIRSDAMIRKEGRAGMLPGVGHLPMLEEPESNADLLLTADQTDAVRWSDVDVAVPRPRLRLPGV